ncbi:hypothetical protein ACFVH9_08510 [Streptomyces hirsutus]|uniref:hypothetical protein n=1 Tax=Streptomyces hirsutus TaxID=35620 RepID=UPI0036388E83
MSIGFRPTPEDNEIIQAHKRPDESTSDVLRRALRALDRDRWEQQAREDMERIAASGEDLSGEPDDWGFDEDGQLEDRRGDAGSGPEAGTIRQTGGSVEHGPYGESSLFQGSSFQGRGDVGGPTALNASLVTERLSQSVHLLKMRHMPDRTRDDLFSMGPLLKEMLQPVRDAMRASEVRPSHRDAAAADAVVTLADDGVVYECKYVGGGTGTLEELSAAAGAAVRRPAEGRRPSAPPKLARLRAAARRARNR